MRNAPTRNARPMTGSRMAVRNAGLQRRQRGVVLLITLIVLVAMMLAGIGMVRSVDTGNIIAGNVAFRQATLQAGDAGMQTAFNMLVGVANSSNPNDKLVLNYQNGQSPSLVQGTVTTTVCSLVTASLCTAGSTINFPGYKATPNNPCEIYPPGSPGGASCPTAAMYQWWTDPNAWANAPSVVVNDSSGQPYATVSYLIHRMCFAPDVYPNATGQVCQTVKQTVSSKGSQAVGATTFTATLVYYRVTTKSVGPRNTVTYAQQLVVLPE